MISITIYKSKLKTAYDSALLKLQPQASGGFYFGFPEDLNRDFAAGDEITTVAVWPKIWPLTDTKPTNGLIVKQRFYFARKVTRSGGGNVLTETETLDFLFGVINKYVTELNAVTGAFTITVPSVNSIKQVELYPMGLLAKDVSVVMLEIDLKLWDCST